VGALVLVVGLQQVHIGKQEKRITQLEALPIAPGTAPEATGRLRRMGTKSAGPRTVGTKTKGGDRTDGSTATEDPGGDASLGKSLRKMVDNPAGRAMMSQGIKAMSSMWFADLVTEFGLNKEEEDYFLRLVAGSMSAQQQIGMKMMGAETPGEREELADEIEKAKKEAKDSIKDFLNNDDDFAAYEDYEKRLPERQQLDGLRAVMNDAEAPLTPEKEDQVIEAMYRARTNQDGGTDWNGTGGMDAIASGNASEKFEQDWEKSSRSAAEELGKTLDGPQLEAFKSYQVQMKDMQLMGIKMAERMFKNSDEATVPDEPVPQQ
jgi:hypothetical protein